MTRIPMGGGGEFDLIRRLLGSDWSAPPGVRVGPGDDCAVWDSGLVASTDLSVEDVHFRFDWITAEEAGFRAAAAALSDLAAMAAKPVGVLLSMALPGREPSALAEDLQAGVSASCLREDVPILGGDLSRSPGPVVLNVTVLGETPNPVLRSGVEAGHEIWVTGRLGGSAAAVARWEGGSQPTGALREKFVRPQPRIREARWLAERVDLGGLIDLSDGLVGDAGHLAAASDLTIVLEPGLIPIHPDVSDASEPGIDPLPIALAGGEDFELCFSVSSGSLDEWLGPFQDTFDLPLTRVGSAEAGEGVVLSSGIGSAGDTFLESFSHFEGKETE